MRSLPLRGLFATFAAGVLPMCSQREAVVADVVSLGESTGLENALPPASPPCPGDMVLIEGNFCPDVEEKCLRWMDPPGRYHEFRCAEYAPSVCKGARRHMRYCIERTEHVDRAKEDGRPQNFLSFEDSERTCKSLGARVCRESEWVFACEGEEMRPYPYGQKRDSSACNVDRATDLGRKGALVDHRIAAGSMSTCQSSFGVFDQAGNLEEWVASDPGDVAKMGWKNVLKGSWWIPSRHHCRGFQIGHDTRYKGAETGTRCCKDAD